MQFEKGPGETWTIRPNPGGHFTASDAGLEGKVIERIDLTPTNGETDDLRTLIDVTCGAGFIALKGCTGQGLPVDWSVEHWYPIGGRSVVREFAPVDLESMISEDNAATQLPI